MVTPAGRHITSPEAVFRDGEHHYRQLLSRMPTAVYTCDAAGVITYFNEQAAEIWGRAPQVGDVSDRFCGSEQLILPDGTRLPHEECPMAVALREGKTFRNQEINIRRPDGSLVTVLVNVDPIRTGEGDLIGAINAFHDVTAIKQAEAAVRRREGWLAGQREALELAMSDAPLQESLAMNADSGVWFAGFTTTVQPAARAGPNLRVIIAAGKFQGVMMAATPTGCRITRIRLSGCDAGIVSP
jgi:PAS domain S-box-containing protein